MTTVTFYKRNDVFYGFTASGHAGGGEEGYDIYCAAISALTQTACVGLSDVAKVKVKLKMRDGFLSALVDEKKAHSVECQTIFMTLLLGLRSFDEGNPGYIQIFEEVQ